MANHHYANYNLLILNTLPVDASTQSASNPDLLHAFTTNKFISNHQFLATTLLSNTTGRSTVRPKHRHTHGNGVRRPGMSASLPTVAAFSSTAQSRRQRLMASLLQCAQVAVRPTRHMTTGHVFSRVSRAIDERARESTEEAAAIFQRFTQGADYGVLPFSRVTQSLPHSGATSH